MAPLLPRISDSSESIDAVASAASGHRAKFLSANLLFLKPGSKEWFMPLIKEAYPYLAPGYSKLYRKTYAPKEYTRDVLKVVDEARHSWGLPAVTQPRQLKPLQGQLQLAFSA